MAVRDTAMNVLAESFSMQLTEVLTTHFRLDFYDCLDIAWRFESKIKKGWIDGMELRDELAPAENLGEVVLVVCSHIKEQLRI